MAGPERQFELMQAMNTLLVNFKKDSPDRKSPEMVWRRIEKLDAYWSEFNSNHVILSNSEDQSHVYFTDKKYELTKHFYSNTKEFLMSHLSQERSVPTPIERPAKITVEQAGPSSQGQETTTNPNAQQSIPPRMSTDYIKIEELLRKQSSNYKAFSRTADSIKLDLIQEKWEFEDALKSLQSRWTAIDALHWEIDSMQDTKDFASEMQYSTYELQYTSIKRLINTKMWSQTYKEKSTPTMEIPTFSGGYQQWTSFKDLFTEAIHTNASLSDAQKMQFLKGKVKGEAEKLIQHLSISSSNYLTCWEILNTRYNNKRLIFTSHLNTLLSLPAIQHPSAAAIKRIHDTTKECLHAITNLGVDTSSWDPIMVHLISQKLDADTHNDYLEHLAAPRELPILQEFLDYLEIKFTALEASRRKQDGSKSSSQQQESSSIDKKAHTYKAYSTKKNSKSSNPQNTNYIECVICRGNHKLFACKAFLELQPEARRKEIAKHRICENCLFDHNGRECYSDKKCRVCNKLHNTLVHDSYYPNYKTQNTRSSNESNKSTSNNTHVSQGNLSETLLSTALIRVQAADNSLITLRALIDQGSQVSLISEHAAQMLKLPRDRCKGVVFGIGAKESTCKGVINIKCMAIHNDYRTNVYVMRSLINNLPNNSFQKPQWSFLENIELADPDFHISHPVDLLLGADVYSTIIQEGIIRPEKTQPVAQQTRFGWILCGHVKTFQYNVVLNNIGDIQNFWSVEDIPETANMSQEDLECLQHYKDTTTRNEDGRYVVKYPYTKDNMEEKLGASKPIAAVQFRNLEPKLSRISKLPRAYRAFIDKYQSLNHMAECTSNMKPSCYLPHQGLERADSSTTTLRNEFNLSSKISSSHWRSGKSAENPAGRASRSISALQLRDHSLWGQEPSSLPTFKEQGEKKSSTYVTDQEVRSVKQSNVTTHHSDDDVIQRVLIQHCNLTRAVRVFAWISGARSRQQDHVPYLTVTETTKHMFIKYVQRNGFSEEIKNHPSNTRLHNESKISNLSPSFTIKSQASIIQHTLEEAYKPERKGKRKRRMFHHLLQLIVDLSISIQRQLMLQESN